MKKLLVLGAASLAVVGVVGATSMGASATYNTDAGTGKGNGNGQGRQASLESRAGVLGMTADELEQALQTKTMSQIAKDQGMTEEDFQAKMRAAAEARWAERGLSSEEIAQRIADREQRHAENSADHEWGSGEGNHQGGYGRNR